MKYERFEELPVWQVAADLAAKMFDWTQHGSFRGKGDLANQLQRAALSISNNIAEGFERGTTKELLSFLYIARGSAGEGRKMLCVMDRMNGFADLRSEI
jgi:four helix bundle protein